MNPSISLTRREAQIAEVLSFGLSKKEVPDYISLTKGGTPVCVRTVEATARNIYKKWGIQKATELTVLWFCKYYNIPLNQCPVKRTLVAVSLLILFTVFEFTSHQELVRSARTRITENRAREGKAREDYLTIEF
jgi:DNA-binding CsgD family transcriptional regulator